MSITQDNRDVKGIFNGLDKYTLHKRQSLLLADVYKYLFDVAEYAADLDRWERREDLVRHCGTSLMFDRYVGPDGRTKDVLTGANFCRMLLCPMCQWRRAQKLYSDMLRMWDFVFGDYHTVEFDDAGNRQLPRLRGVLLTLTVPNVEGDKLRGTISRMSDGWHRLQRYPEYKQIKGYYRCLEVTYNADADTYHPHYHVLCLVTEDYFKSGYVKQSRWLEIWRACMDDASIMQVDVRALRGSTPQAMLKNLNEACKYTVKSCDFLRGTPQASAPIVEVLDRALAGVRRASFGGWLRAARAALRLEQEDDHLDGVLGDGWKRVDSVWWHWASSVGDYVSGDGA